MNATASTAAAAPSSRHGDGVPMNRAQHDRMANAIRALAMDAVEQAKSGHPGLPMGAADIATVLFTQFLKFDPADPAWPDRDRFVLSAGHGSMLIYAVLYLLGYEAMTLDQIKRFRQLGSLTPGHPEHGHTPGVETTTGPLGQGLANAVGMAIAERHLAAEFGGDIVNHSTFVLASDGDLMEGISQEAIALAGHLKLNKLVVLFDDNGISIDGPLSLADSVDQVKRFEAAGWAAMRIDGHDPQAIAAAIAQGEDVRSADHDRLQDHDRLRRADQGRQGERARFAARRRRDQGRAREARLERGAVPDSGRCAHAMARRRSAQQARAQGLGQAVRGASRRQALGIRAPHARRASGGAQCRRARREGEARQGAEGHRHPRGQRVRAGEPHSGGAGDGRRLRRSHRLQQHPHQVDAGDDGAGLFRPLHPLRRARARHGGGDERHGAAWRHHSLFRHVPGVLRLLPARHPAGGADGPARHPRHDARLDRARRGRADAPAGRAAGRVARDPEPQGVPAVRRGRDAGMLAACARSRAERRACWR